MQSTFDEKNVHPTEGHHHPLGRSASFKADDYVHPDRPISFLEDKRTDDTDSEIKADDDDENFEFPPEEHQFTW